MTKLSVVVGSTRPGRVGLPVGQWFFERAKEHGKFEVDLVDLKMLNLPLIDEPKHPRLRDYQHEHTKAWSAIVQASDAFVFVTPEYNFSASPVLLNAIDYLFHEWAYKAAGFVSYGGVSGGIRAVQMPKPPLVVLQVMPTARSGYDPVLRAAPGGRRFPRLRAAGEGRVDHARRAPSLDRRARRCCARSGARSEVGRSHDRLGVPRGAQGEEWMHLRRRHRAPSGMLRRSTPLRRSSGCARASWT